MVGKKSLIPSSLNLTVSKEKNVDFYISLIKKKRLIELLPDTMMKKIDHSSFC